MLPFDDISFPNLIEDGLNGGPNFPVTVLKRRDGTENRIAARKNPVYSFNVGPLIQNESALLLVSNFYASRNGSARAFRFKDWTDFTTAPDDVSLPYGPQAGPPAITAYGVDQPVIPVNGVLTLYKNYSDSQGYLYQRRVFKPRPETFILMSGGSVVPPSSYTLNHLLGTVTTSVGGSLTWGGTFDISARFSPDSDQLFSITWEAFSKGSASITVESVDYYGSGAQFVSGTYYIPVQSVDQGPTGTGEPVNGGPASAGGGGAIGLGGTPEGSVTVCDDCPTLGPIASFMYNDNTYKFNISGLAKKPGSLCSFEKTGNMPYQSTLHVCPGNTGESFNNYTFDAIDVSYSSGGTWHYSASAGGYGIISGTLTGTCTGATLTGTGCNPNVAIIVSS